MRYDAVVIGAGISGLFAGLTLQRAGHRVLIVEARAQSGGLCGTHRLDGIEFVRACNDFGQGMRRALIELGVDVRFEPARARFCFGDATYDLPPSTRTTLPLLRNLPDLWRLAGALRRRRDEMLAPVVHSEVRRRAFAEHVLALSYALALTPQQVRVEALLQELGDAHGYGYARPIVPVGGPGVLVRRLSEAFQEAGGTLHLGTRALGYQRDGDTHVVLTDSGPQLGRTVLSSEGRWERYSDALKPGLCAGLIHLALDGDLRFPRGVRTLTHCPEHCEQWLTRLDQGELPVPFGFHVTLSELPEQDGLRVANLVLLMPRGLDEPGPPQQAAIEAYAFEQCERLLPGFGAALRYQSFVSPKRFLELHGSSSRVTPFVLPVGFRKPDVYEGERDLYFLGSSVGPPGDHAGAAIAAALAAARRAQQRLTGSRARP